MPPKRRKGRKSTEIPEGVSDGLWDMLLSIEGNTAQTSDRVDELEEKVVDLEGKQNTEELAKQVNILSNQVALLGAKLEKCEMKNTSLSNELDQLRAHSMKNNLIFSFDRTSAYSKEAKGENCVALIRDFLHPWAIPIHPSLSIPELPSLILVVHFVALQLVFPQNRK
jgi:polyhydroxyalkanoate synthesis regulator phasin